MSNYLARLHSLIIGMVGVFHIRRVEDSGEQQLCQVNTRPGGPRELEEVIDDVPRMGQYGFAYRPPDGAESIVLFLGGRRSQGVVIATGHRESRLKDLEPGEAALYNGLTGAFVRMSADGKIRSKGDWEHDGYLKATGDVLDHSADNAVTMKAHRDAYNDHDHVETGATTQKAIPLAE